MIGRRGPLVSLVVGVLAAGTIACTESRPAGNVVILGTTNSATNLDPRVGTDEASQKIHQLIFNALVHIDSQLRVVPELAESIEHPDPLTYVARLRHGVLFHNGRELTSEDVVYTFRSFLDPTFKGRSGAYRVVAAVNAIDPYTVDFKLKNPLNSFPVTLVMGIARDGSGAGNARKPIGTGPYRLTEFVPDDHVALAAFDQHFGGRPRNDGVVLKVIPDDTMRGLEL